MLVILTAPLEFAVRTGILSPAVYAAPSEIALRLITLFTQDNFALDLMWTAGRAVISTFLGLPLGFAVGVWLASLERSKNFASALLDFARSLPLTALVPLFISLYGIGERAKLAIGTAAVTLVFSVTTYVGVGDAKKRLHTLLLMYRPSVFKRTTAILMPQALPSLLGGLRLALSSALVLVIVAEMFIGTETGLGKVINDKSYGDDRPGQFAAVLCAGFLGYLFNLVVLSGTRWLLHRLGLEQGESGEVY